MGRGLPLSARGIRLTIILSAGGSPPGPVIKLGGVSKNRSHDALVIGENSLGIATAEEPLRQGARTLGSREGQIYITGHRSDR